jgi:MYXO-CTERM domain-containing protein
VFDAFDQLSATTVSPPPVSCPSPPEGCASFAAPGAEDNSGGSGSSSGGSVTVTNSQVVGPYQTVQLSSTDANALDNWLSTNGYTITDEMKPVIAAYVQSGFDFLALKLVPGQGVQSMRPVRVSFQGASPTLPLRMVAAGTGATVGITLWVVGDGRWEPSNFPWFRIDDKDLVWDWSTSESNYTTLQQQSEAAANNATWEVQASLDEDVASVTSQIQSYASYGYYGGSSGGASTQGADNYEPIAASGSDPGETADQVEQDDVTALFTGISSGTFRLTRLRADLAHAALANDLQLQAASDQSTLTNVRQATQSANGPLCPVYQGCSVVGQAVYTPGASNGSSAFSCSTVAASAPWDTTALFTGALGLLAVGGVASRRRRRH